MTAPIRLRLDQATRTAVSERYEHTRGAVERTNCQMVLLADEGRHAHRDRLAGPTWARSGAHGAASISGRRRGWPGSAQSTRAGAVQVTPAWLAELQRVIELDPAASMCPVRCGRLGCCPPIWNVSPATTRDRDGADASASTGLRVQTTDLVVEAQIDRTGRVGKKRLRVEVLLAAAASPVPPPIDDLLPDPLLRDEVPEDLPWLLRLLPRADVYLQDEVEVALHPTLTRVWCPRAVVGSGWSRLRAITRSSMASAWSTGGMVGSIGSAHLAVERRRSVPSCAEPSNARSSAAGSPWCCLDNLGIHTPKGSLLLRQLLDELRGQLVLVYTPAYDPESNRIEWLWRSLRRAVTHTHQHANAPTTAGGRRHLGTQAHPSEILRQIGSPSPTLFIHRPSGLAHAA